MADRKFLEQLTKKLADEGKLIEAGWIALRLHYLPPDMPPDQVHLMRFAFMAGAEHTFGSIIDMMDESNEPVEADLRRLDLINEELHAFAEELKLHISKPAGSA